MTVLRLVDPKVTPIRRDLSVDDLAALEYVARLIPAMTGALAELHMGVEMRNPVLVAAAAKRFSSFGVLLYEKARELEAAR